MYLGLLWYSFSPGYNGNTIVTHRMNPVMTIHYQECLADMFGATKKHPPPPLFNTCPQPVLSHSRHDTRTGLETLFRFWVTRYSDGRPEGNLSFMIVWLQELARAKAHNKQTRFFELISLREEWEKQGRLEFSTQTHGLTPAHDQYIKDVYALKTTGDTEGREVFQYGSKKQLRKRQQLLAQGKARSRRPDIATLDTETFKVKDKDGVQYTSPEDPAENLEDDVLRQTHN